MEIDDLTSQWLSWPEVTARPMFGGVAVMMQGRMFVILTDSRVAVKLPDQAHHEALHEAGADPFLHRGVPFGNWVYIDSVTGPKSITDWAKTAYDWVKAQPAPPRKKKLWRSAQL